MKKVILLGSQQTQWMIGGRMLPGGTTVELTEDEINKHKDVVISVEGVDAVVEIKAKPKATTKKKVSK